MEKNKYLKIAGLVIIFVVVFLVILLKVSKVFKKEEVMPKIIKQKSELTGNFNIDIIKKTNEKNNNVNYLISPYNIEIALNMLREGASGGTKEELDKVIGKRNINNVSIKDKLNIANALFIKDDYKLDVKDSFINVLNSKYQAEMLYDKFDSPKIINDWVKNKTNGMIEKILDQMNKDFVLGMASALAMDVNWQDSFSCNDTKGEDFTKINNSKINVQMMHKTYESNAKYIKNKDMEGIIIPYETVDSSRLEFVAILPNNKVDDYINNLTKEKLDSIFNNQTLATEKYHINLSLPRFTYSYEVEDFIEVLKNMGIKLAFDPELANFKNMIDIYENVYVGEAIHKTRIELNEKGTKAAAVTYFGMFKNSAMLEKDYEEVDIKFNKPFIYLIRESNTGEILFFGSVFEPDKWNGSTCSK